MVLHASDIWQVLSEGFLDQNLVSQNQAMVLKLY